MSGGATLAFDPALPARDLLLDAGTVGPRLREVLDLPADAGAATAVRVRAKYRPGQSLRVLHRVPTRDGVALVSTRMAAPDRALRLAARAGVGCRDGRPRQVGFDPELGAVSWLFPRDRKIHTLDRLSSPHPDVRRLVPGWVGSELVAYVPERAATARLHGADGETVGYAKVYADEAALAGALSRAAAVTVDEAHTQVPAVLGVSVTDRTVLLQALPGTRLDALAPARLGAGLAALGRSLAAVHRLPPAGLPVTTRLAPDRLRAAAKVVAAVRPDVGAVVAHLAARLCADPPPPRTVLIHGDLHLKNALLADDRLGLLDLDQTGAGHPAADLGSLLAALLHARVAGRLAPSDEQLLGEALLTAYAGAGGRVGEDELRWHVVAALLAERAQRAVNRVLSDALPHLDALLAAATRLVGEPLSAGTDPR